MVARAGRKSRLEQLENAPRAVERMMVVPHRRVVQFARALAKRAGGQSHENLLESYSCRGRVAQLGEPLLCKQGVAGSIPATSTNHLPAISITYYDASAAFFSASAAP